LDLLTALPRDRRGVNHRAQECGAPKSHSKKEVKGLIPRKIYWGGVGRYS